MQKEKSRKNVAPDTRGATSHFHAEQKYCIQECEFNHTLISLHSTSLN